MPDAPLAPTRRLLPLVAWLVALGGVLTGAVALGGVAALTAPPLADPGALAGWAAAREPVAAGFAVLRLVVVALACYLLVVTLLAVVLRLGHAGRLVTAVDVLTLPWVRGAVQGALGVGLVGAAVATVAAAAGETPVRTPAVLPAADVEAGPDGTGGQGEDALVRLPGAGPTAPTMHRVRPVSAPVDHATSAAVVPGRSPESARGQPLPTPSAPEAAAAPAEVEVSIGAGDHLWGLAEQRLSDVWGVAPTDAQVTSYWQALVAANSDRLADPGNPDLVFPGQVLVLVPPPASP